MKDYTCQDNCPTLSPDNDQISQTTHTNQVLENPQNKLANQLTQQPASVSSDNLILNHIKPPESANDAELRNHYPTTYITRSGRQVKPKKIQSM